MFIEYKESIQSNNCYDDILERLNRQGILYDHIFVRNERSEDNEMYVHIHFANEEEKLAYLLCR